MLSLGLEWPVFFPPVQLLCCSLIYSIYPSFQRDAFYINFSSSLRLGKHLLVVGTVLLPMKAPAQLQPHPVSLSQSATPSQPHHPVGLTQSASPSQPHPISLTQSASPGQPHPVGLSSPRLQEYLLLLMFATTTICMEMELTSYQVGLDMVAKLSCSCYDYNLTHLDQWDLWYLEALSVPS